MTEQSLERDLEYFELARQEAINYEVLSKTGPRVRGISAKFLVGGFALLFGIQAMGCDLVSTKTEDKEKRAKAEAALTADDGNYSGLVATVEGADGDGPPPRDLVENVMDMYNTQVDELDTGKEYKKVFDLLKKPLEELSGYDLNSLTKDQKEILSKAYGDFGLAHRMLLTSSEIARKDYSKVIMYYKKALTLNPNNLHTNINLAYLYFRELQDYNNGSLYSGKALEIDQNNSLAKWIHRSCEEKKEEK